MLWMNQTVGAMRCSPCTPRRVVPLMVEESIEGDGVTRNTMGDGVTRNTVIILNAFLPSLYMISLSHCAPAVTTLLHRAPR